MERKVLPSEEFQKRLRELYEKGDVEGIIAFCEKYGERIVDPIIIFKKKAES